ncbi:hypothetical protein DFH07DRAFT_974010 [Mycena maculata]|uniref:Uncharacterized protein n=1 Tax=Mycena maculata TaxID=230809 RepID=A0AAD7HAK4_9AGAR|nr:hypothetical protein DFH07DRAFT_974010 [Mycena maculata]
MSRPTPAASSPTPIASSPPARPTVPDYVIPSLDTALEPHLKFNFERRLHEELALRDPAQPFLGDPLPEELLPAPRPGYADVGVQAGPTVVQVLSAHAKLRQKACHAAQRIERFRAVQAATLACRHAALSVTPGRRAALKVRRGGAFDAGLIEDCEYALHEVVGMQSRFHFRLVPWGGGSPRPVFASDNSLVLLLGGCPRNPGWMKNVVEPATQQCDIAAPSVWRSEAEIASNTSPVLSGGVGVTFNEDVAPSSRGVLLNMIVFFQLFSTLVLYTVPEWT